MKMTSGFLAMRRNSLIALSFPQNISTDHSNPGDNTLELFCTKSLCGAPIQIDGGL